MVSWICFSSLSFPLYETYQQLCKINNRSLASHLKNSHKHSFPYLGLRLCHYKNPPPPSKKKDHCLFLFCSTIQKVFTETCSSGTQPFTMSQKMSAHLSGPRQVFRAGGVGIVSLPALEYTTKTKAA